MTDQITSRPHHSESLGTVKDGELKPSSEYTLFFDDIEEKLNGSLLSVFGVELPVSTVANLPTPPSDKSFLLFVSNATGGSVPAYWDGADWRRVTDRVVVS